MNAYQILQRQLVSVAEAYAEVRADLDQAIAVLPPRGAPQLGPAGPMGPMPRHEWRGTEIRFQQSPIKWGDWKDVGSKTVFLGGGRAAYTGDEAFDGGYVLDGQENMDFGGPGTDYTGAPVFDFGGPASTYAATAVINLGTI